LRTSHLGEANAEELAEALGGGGKAAVEGALTRGSRGRKCMPR
jgi:ABC-type sugar transport system substrate-binding protein